MTKAERILLIEDDRTFSQLLSIAFVKAGHEVLVVPDGLTGLEAADWFEPTVIVLDMYLPILDGWGFLEKYQSTQHSPVYIIATSANDINPASLGEGVDFFAKPFHVQHLLQRVGQRTVF